MRSALNDSKVLGGSPVLMCVIFVTLQNFCETALMNFEFFCYLWQLDYELGTVGDYS
jgi:hypothetical protein